jgi:hypothetical protein
MKNAVLAALLSFLLALSAMAGSAPTVPAQCQVSADLLENDAPLARVAAVLASKRPLRILVLGTAGFSSLGADAAAKAYPARLRAALEGALPGREIDIAVVLHAGETAERQVVQLPALLARHRPDLVVWQTGTVDVMRGADLDGFAAALVAGAAEVQATSADLVLMQPQYGSRAEAVRDMAPYLDAMEQASRGRDIGLFRRHAAMREWADAGWMNLAATARAEQLAIAERVHDCVGRQLAALILAARP